MPEWLKMIFAAVVGGALAIGGDLLVRWWEREMLRDSLRAGLRGEITALAENQGYIHYLEGLLSELKKGVAWEPRDIPVERSMVIYETNAPTIGLLAPCLIEKVADFYQMVNRSERNETNLNGGLFHILEDANKTVWLEAYIASERSLNEKGIKIVQALGEGCK